MLLECLLFDDKCEAKYILATWWTIIW